MPRLPTRQLIYPFFCFLVLPIAGYCFHNPYYWFDMIYVPSFIQFTPAVSATTAIYIKYHLTVFFFHLVKACMYSWLSCADLLSASCSFVRGIKELLSNPASKALPAIFSNSSRVRIMESGIGFSQ